MASKNGDFGLMGHDPLADVDELPSSADDILDGCDPLSLQDTSPPAQEPQPEPVPEQVIGPDAASAAEAVEEEPEPEPETVQAEPVADTSVAEQPAPAVEEPVMTDPNQMTIELGDALTIREVAEVYEQYLAAGSSTAQGFVLSAAELQQVDGAGLQMLTAFVREVEGRGATVAWSGISDPFAEGAAQMGLSEALRLS